MVYSPLQGRLAQRESAAFTRQRSLVRTQHRPLQETSDLQVKRDRPREATHLAQGLWQQCGSNASITTVYREEGPFSKCDPSRWGKWRSLAVTFDPTRPTRVVPRRRSVPSTC